MHLTKATRHNGSVRRSMATDLSADHSTGATQVIPRRVIVCLLRRSKRGMTRTCSLKPVSNPCDNEILCGARRWDIEKNVRDRVRTANALVVVKQIHVRTL